MPEDRVAKRKQGVKQRTIADDSIDADGSVTRKGEFPVMLWPFRV